jgi:hypothetical protein
VAHHTWPLFIPRKGGSTKISRFLFLGAAIIGINIVVIEALPMMFHGQEMSPQDKMQAQMMKYGTPGKAHEFLKRFVGDWDVEITATPPMPGAPPQKSKGTMKSQLIFDGRFLKSDFDGYMGPSASKGLQINGYDLYKNVYTTIWLDSWSTSFLVLAGKLDASGNVLASTGESPDPMTDGKTMEKLRTVVTFMGEGRYKFELYMAAPNGQEQKTLEMVYTRRGMM